MAATLPGLYSAGGPGWYLAHSLQTLAAEIAQGFPRVSCLGTIGDTAHQAEDYSSDHNPFIKAPNGLGVCRAIDLAGPAGDLDILQDHFLAMYRTFDARLYEFGYFHRNNIVSNWPPSVPGSVRFDAGDVGHLHLSVTQRDGNHPGPAGYLPIIDSSAPWGVWAPPPPPPPAPIPVIPPWKGSKMILVRDLTTTAVYLQGDDTKLTYIANVADENAYVAAGLPVVPLTHAFIHGLPGALPDAPVQ